jgi:hypothetical protein
MRKIILRTQILRATIALIATLNFFGINIEEQARANELIDGVVLDEIGNWQISKGHETRAITEGDSIPEGFTLKQPSPLAKITILRENGTVIKCPEQTRICRCVFSSKEGGLPLVDNILKVAFRFLNERPEGFVSTLSRNETVSIADGLAWLDSDKVVLDSAAGLKEGDRLKITNFANSNSTLTATLTSDDHNPCNIEIKDFSPGLYLLETELNATPNHRKAALIAVVKKQDLNEANTNLDLIKKSLGSDTTTYNEPRRQLYRAALAALSNKYAGSDAK